MALNSANGNLPMAGSKFLAPTLKLEDSEGSNLQLQDQQGIMTEPAVNELPLRYMNSVTTQPTTHINYHVKVTNFSNLSPLRLGYKYISSLTKIDSMIPQDLYSDSLINIAGTKLDNYYFDYESGLGSFSKFEKVEELTLPDKFFEEHNKTDSATKLGLFSQIGRVWLSVDNRLIFWNYKMPQSSFNLSAQFLTISQIKHTILAAEIVEPKPGVFMREVNYLLLVATPFDIHIFALKYDKRLNNLEIFNPDLSVSTQGTNVNKFVCNPKTKEIYFSGENGGINVWRLEYSNKSGFSKNQCEKTCLTKGGISSVLPKIPDLFGFGSGSAGVNSSEENNVPESVHQLSVDADRDLLYTLSNKSVIRAYNLKAHQELFAVQTQIAPNEIFRSLSTTFVDSQNFKSFLKFRIMNIVVISPKESSNIQLVAITNFGCRILFKVRFSNAFSLINSAENSAKVRITVGTITFPPSRETPKVDVELDAFTREKQYVSQMIDSQQKSQLLKNTKFAKIISPRTFLCVKRTKGSDKLFVCTANYGFLKKNDRLIEDAEFINVGGSSRASNTPVYIHDVVQLSPSMNATETPNGYANVLATQYTKSPLKFAVLTNYGILIYQYRTPDQILKLLDEQLIENFVEENGFEEACSTLLYLSCSYGHKNLNDLFKRKSLILFSTCGNSARFVESLTKHQASTSYIVPTGRLDQKVSTKQISSPQAEEVILSDRFYGTCMLISRLFREIWNSRVFIPLEHIKFNSSGDLDVSSVKSDNLLIKGIRIAKEQIEFFIGSVIVLIEFFNDNLASIPGLTAPNYSTDPNKFENEVSLRAEHIAFISILKSLSAIKEGLSFLMVLIEEIEANQSNFNEIMKFLSLTSQLNLLKLNFKDLLLANDQVKTLIKDLLSSIINKSIIKGGSIDLIAASLQGRCESFCSKDDVFIFKAIENLTKAKSIGQRDYELKNKCLSNAAQLFDSAHESLTLKTIENAVTIMLELEFYSGVVELLLKLSSKLTKTFAPSGTLVPAKLENSMTVQNNTSARDPEKISEIAEKRSKLNALIFKILMVVDKKAIEFSDRDDQFALNEFMEVRDKTYSICLSAKDKSFHYDFYQWFMDQGVSERLLNIDTPYILPFLEEKSEKSIEMCDVLWLYYAKRENYYSAASILYSLAISEFRINLERRMEYLSRANGFCNCVCPPNIRQKMIQLSSSIQDLLDFANVQLDILFEIRSDKRIKDEDKKVAVSALKWKVLGISDLFNLYAEPLGYYELCLKIFKISDFKNADEILKRWKLLFEKIYYLYSRLKEIKEPFYVSLTNEFKVIGPKLSSNDLVFPIDELIKLMSKFLQQAAEDDPTQKAPVGVIVQILRSSGVSYERIYYLLRSLIEQNTYEIYTWLDKGSQASDMVYLIQSWYDTDNKLKELIPSDKIREMDSYSLQNDPINKFVNETGILI